MVKSDDASHGQQFLDSCFKHWLQEARVELVLVTFVFERSN